jgi:IstB-like ATP binding protein
MSLMYKLVELGERFNRPVPDATFIRRQAQAVKDAVKVRIQPVADYLYMETDQEKFHVERDFPDLTPLWPLACYMWAMPRFFRSEGQILPIDRQGANLFFQLVSRRYERGSLIVTSNQSLGAWGEVFGDTVIASAILDRLLHHSITINIKGDSFRLKEKLKAGLLKSKLEAPLAS